ncbi:hypothetical protein [Clostridium sp. UBA6640]|uniref:hypothetical protein n=1 Tax=Clostridium sp. UBA6640 TaxID=1946370 RepID=UPI0025BD6EE6|nr:hypothetical protein [Clostridium sp. UBA6640]
MYNPAKLWSVIKILEERYKIGLKTSIYISPPNYSVSAEAKAENCSKCDDTIYKAFEEYNMHGDVSIFKMIECSCKKEWKGLLENQNKEEKLDELVKSILEQLINRTQKIISI